MRHTARICTKCLDSYFAEDITITQVARDHYINPYYLSHSFKKMTGYSPKPFLLLTRLAKAKALLSQTSLPVSEISYRSGFSDINNFIRYFKREVGTPPINFGGHRGDSRAQMC